MIRLAKSNTAHFILVISFLLLVLLPSASLAETMGVKNRIKALIPKDSMLRDYEPIPNTEKYLVIYIIDPEIEKYRTIGDYSTCPPLVEGQPIHGEYHLALYKGGYFVNDVTIPRSSHRELGLVYRQPESNRRFISFKEMYPEKDEAFKMKRVKLLTLSDLTGDGLPHQFQLEVFGGACGHALVLTAGYSKKKNKAIVYPIKGENPFRPYYWHDNFYPNENGEVTWEWRCGDHANGIYEREKYVFDKELRAFVLVENESTPCEEKRDWWDG